MNKFFAILNKELLLLWRDKVGLLILFVLPTLLVLFISLIQPNDDLPSQHLKVIFVDQDQGAIGKAINKGLNKIDSFQVTTIKSRTVDSLNQAKEQILQGQSQMLVVTPKHSTEHNKSYLAALNNPRLKRINVDADIHVYLDATLSAALRSQAKISVEIMLQKIQIKSLTAAIRERARAPALSSDQKDFYKTETDYLSNNRTQKASTAQQNVPAWSLFGMFFIVIPLASVMIREYTQGIGQRLFLAPVSYLTLFLGRFLAFASINLIQLFIMLAMGVFILPLFGIAALNLWPNLWPVIVTGACAACAATSFGIFLGAILRTQQQASFLGPFIVVIAAAIGGIFVPIDMMPSILLPVVKLSPLHWAQSAFLDIFVRGDHLGQPGVYNELIKLILFSIGCILLGTLFSRMRKPQTRAME